MPRKKGSKNKNKVVATPETVTTVVANTNNFVQVSEAVGLDGKPLPPTVTTTSYAVIPNGKEMSPEDKALYNAFLNDQIITEDVPNLSKKDEEIPLLEIPKPLREKIRDENGLLRGLEYKYKNGKIDWQAMFNPEYLIYPDDDTTKEPMLRVDGLLDLADIRGVASKHVTVTPISQDMIAVTVTMSFIQNKEDPDGKTWSATADATPGNVGDKRFAKYLTTIAETRATGRCIRQALGIRLCTFEEISTDDSMNKEDTAPIKDTTLAVIKRQMELKGFSEEKLLNLIHEKIAGTKDVALLTQLTVTQGQRVVAYLNSKQNPETPIQ